LLFGSRNSGIIAQQGHTALIYALGRGKTTSKNYATMPIPINGALAQFSGLFMQQSSLECDKQGFTMGFVTDLTDQQWAWVKPVLYCRKNRSPLGY